MSINMKVALLAVHILMVNIVPAKSLAWGNRIRMSDMDIVVARKGYMTTGRKSVPELLCLSGGSAGCPYSYMPDIVTCYNQGGMGLNVKWKCYASMHAGYYLGSTIDVNCEGYAFPGDHYVIPGSCAIRYTMDTTDTIQNALIGIFLFFLVIIFICLFVWNCNWGPTYHAYPYPYYYDRPYYVPRVRTTSTRRIVSGTANSSSR